MIAYVDTSSLLKLLVEEEGSERASVVWDTADVVASASVIVVEARAALATAKRANRLTAAQHRKAKQELNALIDELTIVAITDELVADAAELAEREPLRGYDAVHLAAALTIEATVLTSADSALCDAAGRHGIYVTNPHDA